ncbi:helix-turn-helix transcriptional regulator [Micromonospora sp. NBRC 101691]|uniref:helix-turn-helix domain-containing protein n=1 Tax=Micromonospora sp. NBRC 101691 TaxID=3032198 RepID=UPI002553B848|nr:helix-turn-helix transcriptional regulator [Micromonospora sp. NBRC 101691]
MAQWRTRRRMTQQMLADRLGKSKSWVDKVERGVRALDRVSVIEDLAKVLRVDPAVLLGRTASPSAVTVAVDGIDAVRAALARHDLPAAPSAGLAAPPVAELDRRVGHAWLTYQHADYPYLLRLLPGLLGDTRHAGRDHDTAGLLVQVYRLTASVLVKLGEPDLAWLAADRAMTAAGTDPLRAAIAAIPLGQALRALGRGQLAHAVTVSAARWVAPPTPDEAPADRLSVLGTLLVESALAAASCGDPHSVRTLTGWAADIAERVGDGHDHHWTTFGPTALALARVTAAVALGDVAEAVSLHEQLARRAGWARLPAEHRAAHLIDVARAYLLLGDLGRAGRLLVEADGVAPAETRSRPAARTVIAGVVRGGPAGAGVARLATALGIG